MGKGVAKFHLEAKHNIDRLIASSFSKLSIIKKLRIPDKTNIHISEPIDKLATLRESDLIRK
jgi:hypothetical protein